MHLLPTSLICLLTSTSALALPNAIIPFTPDSSSSTLSKRISSGDKKPWVGSFAPGICQVGYKGAEPAGTKTASEYITACNKWSPTPGMPTIGINFGEGMDSVDEVTLYSDDKCKKRVGPASIAQATGGVGIVCVDVIAGANYFMTG